MCSKQNHRVTQGDGWILKGRTGCVRCTTHLGTWKMSSISCLVAQLTVILDKRMPVFFSRPLLSQTFSLTLIQIHVVVFSESVFHLENLLYPPDISMNACLCIVFCLLAPCWSPGHQNIKVKYMQQGICAKRPSHDMKDANDTEGRARKAPRGCWGPGGAGPQAV